MLLCYHYGVTMFPAITQKAHQHVHGKFKYSWATASARILCLVCISIPTCNCTRTVLSTTRTNKVYQRLSIIFHNTDCHLSAKHIRTLSTVLMLPQREQYFTLPHQSDWSLIVRAQSDQSSSSVQART